MKIDDDVEALVRETLAAVLSKDPDRLRQAIAAFPDGPSVITGVSLAAAVALFSLHDLHGGRTPTSDELADAAEDIAALEDWAGVTPDEIVTYLTAAYEDVPVDQVLPMERVVILAFVIAADLLATYHDEGEQWWDYLDRAEAVIEATPEP